MHPNYPEYKVDVYQLTNEVNWLTGKARIKGDIWLKESTERGKDPKIEILAKGNVKSKRENSNLDV